MNAATTTREIEGFEITIPVGSLDRPTDQCDKWFAEHQDASNWKLATRPFITTSKSVADDFAYTLDWYCGGHEIRESQSVYGGTRVWVVTSKGYYHYIGA
jgi:hypothetical protein